MMTKSVVLLVVIFIVASVQCTSLWSELLKFENSTLISFPNLSLDPVILYDEDGTKIIANVTLPQDAPNSLKIYDVETGTTCDYTNLTTVIGEYRAVPFSNHIAITARRTRADSKTRFSKPGDIWELIILNPKTCDKTVYEIKVKSPFYVAWVLLPISLPASRTSSFSDLKVPAVRSLTDGDLKFYVAVRHPNFENVPNGHYVLEGLAEEYLIKQKSLFQSTGIFIKPYQDDELIKVSQNVSVEFLKNNPGQRLPDENSQKFSWAQPLNSTQSIIHGETEGEFLEFPLSHVSTINFDISTFYSFNGRFHFCYGDKVNSKIITCSRFDWETVYYSGKIINLEHNLKTMLVTKARHEYVSLLIWVESSQEQDYYIKAVSISDEGVFGKVEQLLHTKKEITKIHYYSTELYTYDYEILFIKTNCFSATLRNGSHYDVMKHCFKI